MIKVAINGFGRIGRLAFRQMITGTDFDIVAINTLSDPEEMAYLLKYDTDHGTFHENEISHDEKDLIIAGEKHVKTFAEKDPENLPWKDLEIDLVLECTGKFTDFEGASKHIKAGAKKVLISAPGKGDIKTIVAGVNDNILDGTEQVVSAASCTTNCLAPVLKIINDSNKVTKGFMTTVHAYTNDQATLDVSHDKGIYSRRGRACAQNIVPASTGAASAIGKVIPDLEGKLDGIALRVPVSDGSVVDLTLELESKTTKEEINNLLKGQESEIIRYTEEPIVSCDVKNRKCGALVDGLLTNVIDTPNGQLVKVIAWYDNEYGYTAQMLRTGKCMFK